MVVAYSLLNLDTYGGGVSGEGPGFSWRFGVFGGDFSGIVVPRHGAFFGFQSAEIADIVVSWRGRRVLPHQAIRAAQLPANRREPTRGRRRAPEGYCHPRPHR